MQVAIPFCHLKNNKNYILVFDFNLNYLNTFQNSKTKQKKKPCFGTFCRRCTFCRRRQYVSFFRHVMSPATKRAIFFGTYCRQSAQIVASDKMCRDYFYKNRISTATKCAEKHECIGTFCRRLHVLSRCFCYYLIRAFFISSIVYRRMV